MTTPKTSLNWFEIPVRDLAKASAFYAAVTGHPLKREQTPGRHPLAIFAGEQLGGALIEDPSRKPSNGGVLIYLAVNDSIDQALVRAREAGAKIVTPATDIGPMGVYAVLEDRDGNVVGIHTEAAAKA